MPERPIPNISVWPRFWDGSTHFLEKKFRIGNQPTNDSLHFKGGCVNHRNSDCPNCRRKLSLVWDLDLSDPRFPSFVQEAFAPATRLPLLICWSCLATCYRVISDEAIQPYETSQSYETLGEDESPLSEAPINTLQEPLYFSEIPMLIDGLFELDRLGIMNLDQEAQRAMEAFYGELGISSEEMGNWMTPHRMNMKQYIEDRAFHYQTFSTLGVHHIGNLSQQHHQCPNPNCKKRPTDRLFAFHNFHKSERSPKELALVCRDGHALLDDKFVLLRYYLCPDCFAIGAEHSCD